MIQLKFCPNCNSTSCHLYKIIPGGYITYEILPNVNHYGAIITKYFICQSCRLIFQNPRLSNKDLNTLYSSGYYRKIINKPNQGMKKEESVRNKTNAKFIKKYIGKVNSHLDVGCESGYFLKEVNAKNKVCLESDISYVTQKNIDLCRDIKSVKQKKFDLVSLIHVLEHVSKPLDYLKKISNFVSKDGYLVIEVPSHKSAGEGLGFVHLSFFETDVLKMMLLKIGFEVIEIEFTPHLFLICKRKI